MQEPKIVTVILKDSEKRMNQKFLIYDNIHVSEKDHVIKQCIDEARKSFDGQPESINVKITLEVI